MESKLIAPCGINCAICYAFLREKNTCPGCRVKRIDEPVSRARCKIKNCQIFKKEKYKFCFECKLFPCPINNKIDKRYREKYNLSLIKNLETIKEIGMEKFLEAEEIKWKCKNCGGTICVHKGVCLKCGLI